MEPTVNTAAQPAGTTTPVASELMNFITALAAASGTTPSGLIAQMLAPFEKEIADRIADGVLARIKNTAEVGVQNDALQADFDSGGRLPS